MAYQYNFNWGSGRGLLTTDKRTNLKVFDVGPYRMSSRVLREKFRMRAILKESIANYISLEA